MRRVKERRLRCVRGATKMSCSSYETEFQKHKGDNTTKERPIVEPMKDIKEVQRLIYNQTIGPEGTPEI